MKHKKIFLLTMLCTVLLILTGCGGQSNSENKTSQLATSRTTKNSKTTSSTNKAGQSKSSTLWNSKKDKQLEAFINQWAPKMGQSYTKYDGTNSIKSSNGAVFPDDLSQETVDNSTATVGWSKDGEGKYDYNVVAIYDYDSHTTVKRITYLFAFHDGQPVALVDQSTNGGLVAQPTKNEDVSSSFKSIAEGDYQGNSSSQKSTTSAKSNSSTLERDPKLVSLMVYQEAKGVSLDDINELPLMFGPAEGKYSITGGTGTSGVQFQINGNKVTYWMLDPDSAETDADETMKESSIGLSELESKYYSTASQKQAIKDAADNLRSLR